jgi:streptomycin 6-kinase
VGILSGMTERAAELPLPAALVEAAGEGGRTSWLETLPATVDRLARQWRLDVAAPFQPGGQTAWVAPVRGRAGTDLVLKVVWAHPEALHEAAGLREWAGNGAVRVHAAETSATTFTLLLERCRPGTPLAARPEPEQDEVVAGLLRRLWRLPVPAAGFRPLQEMCDQWAAQFGTRLLADPGRLDAGLAREGIALFRALPAGAGRAALLATDLHAGNVLAAVREPWLVIDPKPYVGDPTYDALQHMLNCAERLHADPEGLVRRMADLLELDTQRLGRWLFARCVQGSLEWPPLADVARRLHID